MQRGPTGSYETSTTAGEAVRAFVPRPLLPRPPLDLSPEQQRLLERVTLALGRLDSITLLLPDPHIFLYGYVRREAVLSSQIERRTGLSYPTAAKAVEALKRLGVVSEITGRRRNRIYAYRRYLDILSEGAEPLR